VIAVMTTLPDVHEQLNDVKAEATELRNFTISFLSLLLYINLIIAQTDAEQILRVAPVTLPLLNVPLPIIGFYAFTPWLLLLFHLYLLIQHYLFSQQLFLFKTLLNAPSIDVNVQKHILKNLGNLPFLHWMVGEHQSIMQFVLTLITLVCLIIWPLLTLLWLQMAILPYHDNILIWNQRLTIIIDVSLIAWLWAKTLAENDDCRTWWKAGLTGFIDLILFIPRCLLWLMRFFPYLQRSLPNMLKRVSIAILAISLLMTLWLTLANAAWLLACAAILAIMLLSLLWWRYRNTSMPTAPAVLWQSVKTALTDTLSRTLLFIGLLLTLCLSLLVATLPDSDEEQWLVDNINEQANKPNDSFWLKTVDVNFWGTTTRMAFMPTARLHEQHAQLFDSENDGYQILLAQGAKPCPNSEKPTDGANQDSKKLCLMVQPSFPRNLILREKVLTADTNLKPELEAKLQVSRNKKELEQTLLDQIHGLDLKNRNFDYADFTDSSLPKVDLRYASLKNAVLPKARLEQAKLNAAHLEHINLNFANLTGATLDSANLTSASLYKANLTGATLDEANLTSASLYKANLTGATLDEANLTSAILDEANLTGATLYSANLADATLYSANLTGANLNSANLIGATLNYANLTGALLTFNPVPTTNDLEKIKQDYRRQLTTLPYYQTDQAALDERLKAFEERLKQPLDFSTVRAIKLCLRNTDTEKLLPYCVDRKNIDSQTQADLTKLWLDLACQDGSEKHPLANSMVNKIYDFRWFAKPVLEATKDATNCKGLASLPDDRKAELQKIVDEETKRLATPE
jgi:uncharacterized protein YjbI with pentapeptide repeats